MITEISEKVLDGKYLNFKELEFFMQGVRNGSINSLQFVSFLAAMETRNRIKGLDIDECANFLRALRLPRSEKISGLLCNAGTGGDKIKTINVGTTSSLVIASAGINVLKIGYRGVTSKCGSRDLLMAWGIDPFQSIDCSISSVKDIGIGYYDFSKLVVNEDRSGFKSPLHFLGPLSHPLELEYKVLGCVNMGHLKFCESVLEKTCENYILSYNPDLDEISTITDTFISEKRNKVKKEYWLKVTDLDLKKANYTDLEHPESKEEGARLVSEVLAGVRSSKSDLVALNAGAAIYLANKSESIQEGMEIAKQLLYSGKAQEKLDQWRKHQ